MPRKPGVMGDTPVHTVVVDWDGTAVPAMWPERPTEFMPGFVDNMRRLHAAGIDLVISSARLNPRDPWTGELRPEAEMAAERQYVRDTLDRAGLTFIRIHSGVGKPGGSVYVDDKAERYHGCNGCWTRLTDKILLRLGETEAVFPAERSE